MKCIIGLGNPGKKYDRTRHNVGFMVIDELIQRHQWKLDKSKFKADYTIVQTENEKLMLVKPQTFMNLSGDAVRPLMDYYHIHLENILIIFDDLDLPIGKIRLRQKGGHGGHNGIRSIIEHVGSKDFKRVRIGIGRPDSSLSIIDYVLQTFPKRDTEEVMNSVNKAADACEAWVHKPFPEVMNEYNQ
ncbi:peptidyl-tRNA hydrolase [Virgibacillus pantothenticus]|uniref:Peptidyl-tRNA hydrolase n=1 Tax=Virgibacillus pantothenticus TaxID=1473 RepID=A0A0L0QR59_VIRPA|nr:MULTISPECIES: aminoacyl-tRNA hydrolase [Virgibacillus]API92317.1 aminoacyl-tRNA hydrolase [Virgibacillus sp. 6R]KNE21074.1 peptidyl-tRNA hydrolase [Virgibacillus pantothenticus]MBS7427083.1 aminoacyl-tRNA hydrolase [Virgibacillus sp. 19R1-5]MBU8568144.1 aminoacyl-tRNA hydrolase [Virgibacillus pantothenticus]MBU8602156.1 aminoacyl-tRNA hydrolase [Virgibacillus pantothenticus]